jgi:nucleoid-associated protein YgaU
VTVRPGDSLWSIAARRLGTSPSTARIQQEWPRWYAANRQLIGTDPNLLLPGTRLLAPRPASTDTGA